MDEEKAVTEPQGADERDARLCEEYDKEIGRQTGGLGTALVCLALASPVCGVCAFATGHTAFGLNPIAVGAAGLVAFGFAYNRLSNSKAVKARTLEAVGYEPTREQREAQTRHKAELTRAKYEKRAQAKQQAKDEKAKKAEEKRQRELEAARARGALRPAAAPSPSPRKLNKRNPSICPKCGSGDTIALGSVKKSIAARAAVGGFVAGVPGAAVGALSGRGMRSQMMCRSCGARWVIK